MYFFDTSYAFKKYMYNSMQATVPFFHGGGGGGGGGGTIFLTIFL